MASTEGRHPPGEDDSRTKSVPFFARSKLRSSTVMAWRAISPSVVQQRGAGAEEGVVLAPVDGLDHLDGDQLVEGAVEVPVVAVEHGDPVGQAVLDHPLGGVPELGVRDGGGGDPAAVGRGGVDGEAAPSGADLDHVVVGAEAELGAQAVELGPLGVGQAHRRGGRRRPTSTSWSRPASGRRTRWTGRSGTWMLLPVVVPGPGAAAGGTSRWPSPTTWPDPVLDGGDRPQAPGEHPDQGGEVVAVPQAVGVVAAEPDRALAEDVPVDGGVVDDHGDLGRPGAEPVGAPRRPPGSASRRGGGTP